MLQILKHRAPDDEGVYTDKKFSIGMGRLAILDLKSDNLCPHIEGKFVLTFNGEIYNYLELRKELISKGHLFKTMSDTEVLLKSFIEWKEECLDKLNGMFAFAIYDGEKIFMARDIAGEKPLYYTEEPFEFASEAKALKNPKELPPAYCATYNVSDETFHMKRWWRFKPRHINMESAEEELEWLIGDSIKLRTRSDVPYGLYLSGGVDSSLISTYHDFKHTFTYKDGDYKKEFLEKAPKIYYHLDGPIESFSPFGLWKLAEEASKEVKVVLSGEGADELFGGYVRYIPNEFNRRAQQKFPSYKGMFPYEDLGWKEFNGNMRELLRMGDRMSSAHGLENRCPFLDKRIIEFAFSLPPEAKIGGFNTKKILKRILKRRMPKYKNIEKEGLYCSVNKWIGSRETFQKNDYLKWQNSL